MVIPPRHLDEGQGLRKLLPGEDLGSTYNDRRLPKRYLLYYLEEVANCYNNRDTS